MDNSNFKGTVFLMFTGLADENGEQVTICEEVTRRWFFGNQDYWGSRVKHFYQGNKVDVYAIFQSDTFDPPSHEDGLKFVIAWFDGYFVRRNVYDAEAAIEGQ